MSDQTVTEKLVEALTSTEALAAFLGAFAAFLLEAIRRWRSERLANLAAGNEAVFALSQMYTLVTNLNNQMFVDRVAEVRKLLGRDPLYIEVLPMEAGSDDVMRLPLDRLGFLLGSYEPDILNRIAACDRAFGDESCGHASNSGAHLFGFRGRSQVADIELARASPAYEPLSRTGASARRRTEGASAARATPPC